MEICHVTQVLAKKIRPLFIEVPSEEILFLIERGRNMNMRLGGRRASCDHKGKSYT